MSGISPPPFYFSYDLNFFLDTLELFSFVHVAMLSLCQSPVNCWNEKVEDKFRHKVNFYSYLKGRGDRRIFQIPYFFDNYVGTDDWQWQKRYTRVRWSSAWRTKQGRKTCALWAISWYRRMYSVIDEVSHKARSLYDLNIIDSW